MDLALDKIRQAAFFLEKSRLLDPNDRDGHRYYLEAAITMARSATLLLQKQYHDTVGFAEWYATVQAKLSADNLARFLRDKRNYVLKEGSLAIRRIASVEISETAHVEDFISVKVIRGSWKSRLRHLWPDLKFTLVQAWKEFMWKHARRRPRANPSTQQSAISEGLFFAETEWSSTPAMDLISLHLLDLHAIVLEAARLFKPGDLNTNGV